MTGWASDVGLQRWPISAARAAMDGRSSVSAENDPACGELPNMSVPSFFNDTNRLIPYAC